MPITKNILCLTLPAAFIWQKETYLREQQSQVEKYKRSAWQYKMPWKFSLNS